MKPKNNKAQDKLDNFLKLNLAEDEVVLWQGKPELKIFFKEEIHYLLNNIIIYLIGITLGFFMFSLSQLWIIALICSPLLIAWLFYAYNWFYRKKITLFIITNFRVMQIFIEDNNVMKIEKKLNSLINYEKRYSKKGGNLYLGRYRLKNFTSFDYTKKESSISPQDGMYTHTINRYMNHIDYFAFFDLADVDTPAAIVKEYALNAVEYIDPKIIV